jgi:hypothetical protein
VAARYRGLPDLSISGLLRRHGNAPLTSPVIHSFTLSLTLGTVPVSLGQSVVVDRKRGIRMSDATRLRVQAALCFRLARGPASSRLADELEALGRAFEREAKEVEETLLRQSSARHTKRLSQHSVEAREMAETV